MKREFDFDLAASVTFDLAADSSHSLPRVYRDILEDLSAELHVVQKLSQPLAYAGLVMLAFAFLRSGRVLCSTHHSHTRQHALALH